jgi:hypothetical protein
MNEETSWLAGDRLMNRRLDIELFCPRVARMVLIIEGVCFFAGRGKVCQGCICDVNFVLVKLMLVLSDLDTHTRREVFSDPKKKMAGCAGEQHG